MKKPYQPGFFRFFLHCLAVLILLPVALTLVYRFVPVPLTPLMVIRLFEGNGLHKTWVPLESIAPSLRKSVIAAEDNAFCAHEGFDWKAINKAAARYQKQAENPTRHPRKVKGGSTISQQTAKNLFLWPTSSLLRKALEFPLTYLLEAFLPKNRILEIYLNVAEFGPGVYGAEAAARYHFKTTAARLTPQQSALLAAILPNPRHWSASHPGPYITRRAGLIRARTPYLGTPYLACTRPEN